MKLLNISRCSQDASKHPLRIVNKNTEIIIMWYQSGIYKMYTNLFSTLLSNYVPITKSDTLTELWWI